MRSHSQVRHFAIHLLKDSLLAAKLPEYCGVAIFFITKMSHLLSLLFKREGLPPNHQAAFFDLGVKYLLEMRHFEEKNKA